jgi:hypothetical protein
MIGKFGPIILTLIVDKSKGRNYHFARLSKMKWEEHGTAKKM